MEYRVETLTWDGPQVGAAHMESRLNEYAADGWEVVNVLQITAGTSMKALVGTQASSTVNEFAVVLRRDATPPARRRKPTTD